MASLLKSNFYRLFKSKAFYICTIVYTALTSLSLLILKLADNIVSENITVESNIDGFMIYKDGLSFGVELFSNGDGILFLAVFIAIFITSEFTYGTMKNIVSKGFERHKIYISIFLTMVVAALIMVTFNFLFSTFIASILTGSIGSYNGTLLLKTLRLVGIEILLHSAFVSLFVMISIIIRNNGGVIAINVLILMFGGLIYQILELVVRNLLKIDIKFSFSDYSLQNNIYLAKTTMDGEHILRPILVGLIFLVITLALGIIAFRKSDVK